MKTDSARFAVYYAPSPDSALWRFCSAWLGRDAVTGARLESPVRGDFDPVWLAAITASPRHYGFHGTLKPPFVLAEGKTPEALSDRLSDFAATRPVFTLPTLALRTLDGFLALAPTAPSSPLQALAAACVQELDDFRRPPDASELQRRRAAGLNPRQDALLRSWGYPYVLDEFRFHLTLSERLEKTQGDRLSRLLEPMLAPLLAQPLRVDAVCLFAQLSRSEPFRLLDRYGFKGIERRITHDAAAGYD
ncbi:MAG: DUF1045 domain-containing protein [Gammaproteobacteria bacterium]|nr:DUF1045 domain-containing protein [Gammaproteobacteria bacterium]MCP5425049.1 DUF1045 domain-containing protein [Gammaproteobacteria bacterium]MCP5459752.1 DUF1045 domain-containing protein [Gammaproteobacteria bacterium]